MLFPLFRIIISFPAIHTLFFSHRVKIQKKKSDREWGEEKSYFLGRENENSTARKSHIMQLFSADTTG